MSKKDKKITKKEFESIQEIQSKNISNISQIGNLEYQIQKITQQKSILIDSIDELETEFQSLLKTLEKKYGVINLDLSTGIFTEVKEIQEAVTE